jgi:hypothetical protein
MTYAAPNVILGIDEDGYGLLMNLQTGKYYAVSRTTVTLWTLLDGGLDLDAAMRQLASRHDVSLATVQRDTEEAIQELRRGRMLASRSKRGRLAERVAATIGSPAQRIVATSDVTLSKPQMAAAWAGFVLALVLQRLPYRLTLRAMTTIRASRAQRPEPHATRQMVATLYGIVWRSPGWAECHEVSVPAYLALAMLGRAPTWLLEATFTAGVGLHACLCDDDAAIDAVPQPRSRRLPLIQI